jgi:hypothetical protein
VSRRLQSRTRALPLLAALLLAAGCSAPGDPRVEGPLALDIPELCTVCIEVLRCEGGGRHVAYVMDEKDAWAQVVTIWDYFAAFFRPKTEDFRKLTVYELGADGATVTSRSPGAQARLDVWHRRVELPGAVIEQKTGAWLGADGAALGSCTHLPRGEDRKFAQQLAAAGR